MAINDIILRATSYPPLTTKGSELTLGELDNNFVQLYAYLISMNSGGAVPAFNMATTYTGTKYVSYSGRIYQHISATPTVGVIPTSNPAKWAEVTLGPLVHVPNTDTKLAEGTANEVSAADLKLLVSSFVNTVTEAALSTLVATDGLTPGRIYAVTDVVLNGVVYLTAYTANRLSPDGVLVVWVPDPGVTVAGAHSWEDGASYAVADLVAWDGYVYKNNTGANGAATPPNDGTNWQVQAVAANVYNQEAFTARITWDGGSNMTVRELTDIHSGNVVDGNAIGATYFRALPPTGFFTGNKADHLSDIGQLGRNTGGAANNVFVSSAIELDYGGRMVFTGNRLEGSRMSFPLYPDTVIENNTLVNTHLRWELGADSGTELSDCTFNFHEYTTLQVRPDFGTVTGKLVSDAGSNVEDTVDMTGNTKLILNTNGAPDIYGTIIATSTNATETLDKIENGTRKFPLVIRPGAGLAITVNLVSAAAIGGNDEIIGPVTSFVLNGDYGDYMIVKPVTVNGFDVHQVTNYYVNL